MEWAVAMEYRADNPCHRIGPVLGRQQENVQHMAALPHREVAGALAATRSSSARPVVKLAFEFLVLTAARSGEVRGARWSEIDVAERLWTVPAPRMKTNREHRVPLCRWAVETLDRAQALGNGSPLVFPTARGKPLKDMALSGLLKALDIAAVPHGFRSSFRLGVGGDGSSDRTSSPGSRLARCRGQRPSPWALIFRGMRERHRGTDRASAYFLRRRWRKHRSRHRGSFPIQRFRLWVTVLQRFAVRRMRRATVCHSASCPWPDPTIACATRGGACPGCRPRALAARS